MEDQQRLNNLLNEINAYRQQAELIQQQIDLIQTSIAEVDALSNTLDDLEGKDSVEAFVPVGAGSFIKGELKSTDEIIVSIGSGFAVKKDADGAREILATRCWLTYSNAQILSEIFRLRLSNWRLPLKAT